ncbi:MAG TPA: DUF488 domain-containing protein [Pirellulales bacterium]|jgi:uncharacterized protein (DUF488 family)|nr:DUF488 domain-containing protein [Pirellulales bacterium]
MTIVHTIGHSTLPADEFYRLLRLHGVQHVIDVRRFPGSRRWPHFNREAMEQWLADVSISYRHEPALGGRRSGRRSGRSESPNTFWESPSFRAFADYMATPEFSAGLEKLIAEAGDRSMAIMCSEAVPWHCHRRLIADALVARGIEVRDILGAAARPYALNPHARVTADGHLEYPAEAS